MAKNSGPVRTVHARTTGKERDEMIATTKAEIEKKFGQGSIMRYGDGGPELEVEAIPTGALALDAALGIGGVPRGRIVEIYGPESSGKTTLSLEILAEAQAMGGVVAFIDAEHALDPTYAARIGVDIDEVLISQPDTGEQALEIVDMLVRSGAIDAIVVDSVAALTPRAEIEGEIGDTTVGLQARLMSQALRKLAGSLSKSNTTCIFINQLREKIGVMFGNPETTTGGRALKFFSSVRIDIRRIDSIKLKDEVIGNRVRAKVVKNKVAAPFRSAEFDIMYGEGIAHTGELIDLGVRLGIIPVNEQFKRVISVCVGMKRNVVRGDEFDRGQRALLNLGHTVGHAVESCSGFTLLHGEGVAIGMAIITRAAVEKGLCTLETLPRLLAVLERYGLPTETDYPLTDILAAAEADKKRTDDVTKFIVPERVGHCRVEPVPADEVAGWLKAGGLR